MNVCSLCYSVSEGERSSPEETARPLKFESRFESGNLRKAIQVHVICSAVCSRKGVGKGEIHVQRRKVNGDKPFCFRFC